MGDKAFQYLTESPLIQVNREFQYCYNTMVIAALFRFKYLYNLGDSIYT